VRTHLGIQMAANGIEGVAEDGESLVESAAHAGMLTALSGQEQGELAVGLGVATHDVGRGVALGEGFERLEDGAAVARDHRRPPLEVRARGGERIGDVQKLEVGMGIEMRSEPAGLRPEGRFGLG
jgi:hypothetical protein